jgi:hypothetical protein
LSWPAPAAARAAPAAWLDGGGDCLVSVGGDGAVVEYSAALRPDAARVGGVRLGQFDGEHLRRGRGPRDPKRAVAAVGAEFERDRRVRATHGGVDPKYRPRAYNEGPKGE